MNCPECNAPMILRRTNKFKTKDGKARLFYGCSKWPECNATHGAHPNGEPLGVPATPEVKALRMKAHKLLEGIFGKWEEIGKDKKRSMYDWLKHNTKSGHIGKMEKAELICLIKGLELNEKGAL